MSGLKLKLKLTENGGNVTRLKTRQNISSLLLAKVQKVEEEDIYK